jgi:DNA repair/transcription protein MET18/MMS19
MSLKGHISSFVDVSVSDAVHQESLAAIVSHLKSSKDGFVVVVELLEDALVNPSGVTRARGVLLLVSLLQALPVEKLTDEELGFLMVFFRDRSRDSPCVSEVVAGLSALLLRWGHALKSDAVEAMLVTLFAEVFVQGLDQPTRHSVFRLLELVVTKAPAAAASLNHDFVFGYLQMIDGERDPRNLLLIFSLTPRVLAQVPGWERLAEELFDVSACYYPINYKPRGDNDPITPKMLVDALDSVMTCCSQFSNYYYPFMMEKLEGEHSHLWSSLARSIGAFGDGGRSFLPHAFVFWGAIQSDAFEGKDADTVQGACAAVTQIISALSENLVTHSSGASSLDPILEPLLRVCTAKLLLTDSKVQFFFWGGQEKEY